MKSFKVLGRLRDLYDEFKCTSEHSFALMTVKVSQSIKTPLAVAELNVGDKNQTGLLIFARASLFCNIKKYSIFRPLLLG